MEPGHSRHDQAAQEARLPHLCDSFQIGGNGAIVAVKDVIDVAGHQTRLGSQAFEDVAPARRHAAVVQLLLDAKCRVVGKLLMHELAFGMTGINSWAGTPPNPRFPTFVPGGSSSGSATIVAAGLVDFSLGTDTGGSIRVPAACCGVAGLKPTFGRLSRDGLTPAQSSLDCVGPLARDVETLTVAMTILDKGFERRPTPERVRLGWIAGAGNVQHAATVRARLDASRIELVDVELPGLAEAFEAGLTIMNAEMAECFGHFVGSGKLGSDVEERLRASLSITRDAVAEAEGIRRRFRADVDRALEGVDALALPTLPDLPLKLTEANDAAAARAASRLVRPFNLSGHPALSLPVPDRQGRPLALQLVGRRGGDEDLCAVAACVEATQSRVSAELAN